MPKPRFEDRTDLKLLAKIEQHLAKQTQMLEAMSLALVGQDKAVEAVMEMLGQDREEKRQEDIVQRASRHEARILKELQEPFAQWYGSKIRGPDDVQELPEREDA